MGDHISKVEAWECDYCGSLHDHPSLAEKCAVKCRWYRLTDELAEELDAHPKLERPERLDELEAELEELREQKSDT